MIRHMRKRKCKHCKTFFTPDPRNVGRQHYCAKPLCRQASKAASQRRWLRKPENHDYFRGPAHVERVRQWRQHPPGSWRRKTVQASEAPEAFQDSFTPPSLETQPRAERLPQPPFHETQRQSFEEWATSLATGCIGWLNRAFHRIVVTR